MLNALFFLCQFLDLGEPTHTLIPWMPKPLPPRNQCTGWFALASILKSTPNRTPLTK